MADTAQRRRGAQLTGPGGQAGQWPAPPARVRLATFVRRHKLAPYLLLAPALAGIALVLLWPLAQMVMFSFQNYGLPQLTGVMPIQWIGLGNFTATFADPEFWVSLRNTVAFAVVVVPLTLITGTSIGLLLNRLGRKMSAFVAGAALLAWATPPTAGAVLFYWLFNPDGGLVDWGLSKMPHWLVGSTNWAQYNWTTNGALQAYTVLTVLVLWTSFPFVAVAVLAGLKTVPAELYEAAWVDGATKWRVFWKITYPLLKPIFLVLLLLSVIWDFNIFTQTYLITGFPGNQNEYNLSLYIYDKAFNFPPSYGLGGALALIFTLILLVITVGYVRTSVRQGVLS
ncbi:MAG TPA: sugar ABC transporter permease [Streptosporangiaceae bacterium]